MKTVFVRFNALTSAYSKVYHRAQCRTLNYGVSAVKEIRWKDAFDRNISACLLCHRFKVREFLCPINEKHGPLKPLDLDGQLILECSCGFIIKQKLIE